MNSAMSTPSDEIVASSTDSIIVKESGLPLRRSERERNRIPTNSLRRLRSLFWDGDARYDKRKLRHSVVLETATSVDNDDESTTSTTTNNEQESSSAESPRKRPRVQLVKDDPRQQESDNSVVIDHSIASDFINSAPSVLTLSQSTAETAVTAEYHGQHSQQQLPQNRWWPKRIKLQKIYDTPHIYVADNFLTSSQLEFLHQLIEQRQQLHRTEGQQRVRRRKLGTTGCDGWQRSFCDTDKGTVVIDDQHRTSSFFSLPKQSHKIIRDIERTAADLLGVQVQQLEALQLVRYRSGEFFGLHHDLGELVVNESDDDHKSLDTAAGASVLLPPKSIYGIPRRVATLFCYLNTLPPQCGGATYFPLCDKLQVQPQAGRAVLFCNITPQGQPEPKTIHAGQPIISQSDAETTFRASRCTSEVNVSLNDKNEFGTSGIPQSTLGEQQQQPQQLKQNLDFSSLNVKYGLNIWACEE